jgi:hypothetical protein
MAEPRVISIDPITGIATWETPTGSTMQTAYAGLPAPLQQQYQQQVSDQYTSGLQSANAPTPPQAPARVEPVSAAEFRSSSPDQRQELLNRQEAYRRQTESENAASERAQADRMARFRQASPAERQRMLSEERAAAPAEADPAESASPASSPAPAGETFVDLAAPRQASPGSSRNGQPTVMGMTLAELRQLPPGARIGGQGGRLATVQGPSQTSTRVADPSLRPAVERLGAAEASLADTQQRELAPALVRREAMASEMANQALAAEDAQLQIADVNRRRAEALAAERQKYEKISAEHIAAEQQGIDPNRYFENRSTGERIMSGIGLILGGIGAGLTGRENVAFKVIDDAIERDIMAQRENLAAKGRAAERQRGVMADVATVYDDEAAQVLAARGLLWDASMRRIAELEAMATNDEARANLAALREQAAVKRAQLEVELATQLGSNVVTSERQAMVGGQPGVKVSDAIKMLEGQGAGLSVYGAGDKTPGDLFVREYQGNAPTGVEAQKLRKTAAVMNTYEGLMRQLIKFRSSAGNMTDPQRRAAAQSIAAECDRPQEVRGDDEPRRSRWS